MIELTLFMVGGGVLQQLLKKKNKKKKTNVKRMGIHDILQKHGVCPSPGVPLLFYFR